MTVQTMHLSIIKTEYTCTRGLFIYNKDYFFISFISLNKKERLKSPHKTYQSIINFKCDTRFSIKSSVSSHFLAGFGKSAPYKSDQNASRHKIDENRFTFN